MNRRSQQIAILAVALSMVLTAASAETGCVAGNCRNGQGTWIYDGDQQGQRYEGAFRRGQRHGHGVHHYTDGIYEGRWHRNKRRGQGTYQHQSGHRYTGEWRDDQPHGEGSFTHATGNQYVGDWQQGVRDGHGVMTRTDGSRYEGGWQNDQYQG
ncbi:MAG: hypothetical protein AAF525_17695, partial [Pseudomonadota bacterium]